MLRIERLTGRFGTVVAVDAVSLTVPKGQFVGVIGRSGAGKSTLLRLVNRLVEPAEGRVLWQDRDVSGLKGRDLREWRRRCAMIFQQFNLVPRLDVLTNVLVGRVGDHGVLTVLAKWFSARERTMALTALDRLGVVEQALQRADTLSGGQQQRVAIARALMQEPEILLADEPIASLDPVNAVVVMEALAAINREDGITVICNLHSLATARQYCQRVVGLAHGRVVFDDVPEALHDGVVAEIYGATGVPREEPGHLPAEIKAGRDGLGRHGALAPQTT